MGRNSVIGLDIGTSAVRAAELDLRRNPPTLVRFGQVMLPPGAVRDGEILDELAVGEKLAELWKRAGFKSKRVAVGVSNQRVIVRQVEMPWMEESDLAQGSRSRSRTTSRSRWRTPSSTSRSSRSSQDPTTSA